MYVRTYVLRSDKCFICSPWCTRVCVHTHAYVHIHMYIIHACTYVCRACICIHMCTCIPRVSRSCRFIGTPLSTSACTVPMFPQKEAQCRTDFCFMWCVFAYVCLCMCMYVCVCVYIYISYHAHTHIHACTYRKTKRLFPGYRAYMLVTQAETPYMYTCVNMRT
jgi:hypothetical protein